MYWGQDDYDADKNEEADEEDVCEQAVNKYSEV